MSYKAAVAILVLLFLPLLLFLWPAPPIRAAGPSMDQPAADGHPHRVSALTPPSIEITKTTTTPNPVAGQQITFTIDVTNTGSSPATNVMITDTLPSAAGVNWLFNILSFSAPPGSHCDLGIAGPGVLRCTAPTMNPGQHLHLAVLSNTTINTCGTLDNTAEATDASGDRVQASASIHIQCANLIFTKMTTTPNVAAGQPITFTIDVTNTGPVATTNVLITDTLPSAAGVDWLFNIPSFSAPPGSHCDLDVAGPGVLRCTAPTMNPGQYLHLAVLSNTTTDSCGTLDNTARMTASNGSSAQASASIDVSCKTATTTSVSSAPNPSTYGQSVTFTANVTSTSGAIPTGTVQFYDNGSALGSPVTLSGGQATTSTSSLAIGLHPITAAFSGVDYLPSVSDLYTQTVNGIAPTITSADHTTMYVGVPGAFTVTTSGAPTPTIGGTGVPPATVGLTDHHDGTAALEGTPAQGTVGDYHLTITATNGILPNASQPFTLTVLNPSPTLTAISPSSGSAGGPAFTLTLTGTNFVTDSAVLWNGSPRPTGFVSGTQLTATIPASDLTSQGTFDVTISNPQWQGQGGGTSNARPFTVGQTNTALALVANPTAVTVGQTITFTSTLTQLYPAGSRARAAQDVTPTGSVVFTIDGTTHVTRAMGTNGITTYTTNGLAVGTHTVVATYGGDANLVGSTSNTVTVNIAALEFYLPFVGRGYVAPAPNLVVQSITATSNNIQVVIQNIGQLPVANDFWVDLYVNPNPPPTKVNQTWPMLSTQGAVWGVTGSGRAALTPGGTLTLTLNDAYYFASLSTLNRPLATGAAVYVQVDSADASTTYGEVLETHEQSGGAYDNIRSTTVGAGAAPNLKAPQASDPPRGSLPVRP